MQVTQKQWKALKAVCDAIVASVPEMDNSLGRAKASDNNTAERILAAADALPESDRKELGILLNLLASPMLGLTYGGPLKPFDALAPAQQVRLLQSWNLSKLGKLRQAFHTLRKLASFHFYAHSVDQPNPVWETMGYPGPPLPEPKAVTQYSFVLPKAGEVVECEALVIGSGAAGGVAAGLLAEAGNDVLVVEKGPFLDEYAMNQREGEMVGKLYDRAGALATKDGGVTIFAGSCWGGGTTVNWAGSFRTPAYVLEEWAKEYALPQLLESSFAESMDAIWQAMQVNDRESPDNGQNTALRAGSKQLGLPTAVIERNTEGCMDHGTRLCGWCGYGCRYGGKQATPRNWLKRAAARGARMMERCTIERIILENGKATGAEATYTDPMGKQHSFRIRAKAVVLAAGSIHSPALLLRSGIRHPHLGKHLHLHPTVAISGQYAHAINPWEGAMMTALNDQFARMDGNFGVRLETPPTHPGLMAMALPWTNATDHKDLLSRSQYAANFIVLTRDRDGGQVKIDKQGQAAVHYRLSPYDRKHLVQGVVEAIKIHIAAGALEVLSPNYRMQRIRPEEVNRLENALDWGWGPNQFSLFSAHQMGTCRMGGGASQAPVRPDGSVVGAQGLYVCDGSVFPSASGANPMVTVMTFAHFITKTISIPKT